MGIMPWSPLAGGFLSGKYTRAKTADTGRLSGANPFGDSKFVDRNWDILDVLKSVANDLDRPAAQVALAWTLARPGVASTLIGASKVSQLDSNIAAKDIRLSAEQLQRLDAASTPAPGFSSSLAQPFIRRMVFGGPEVTGWGEWVAAADRTAVREPSGENRRRECPYIYRCTHSFADDR